MTISRSNGFVLVFSGFLVLLISLWIHPSMSEAAGRIYFINNTVSCSDSGGGTTKELPWCNISNVNGKHFNPGDKILLARGATWKDQSMIFEESGNSTGEIELSAYGNGVRPKIIGSNSPFSKGIKFVNASFWNINNLEVSNYGTGILFYYSTHSNEQIKVSNVYVHHVAGIEKGIPIDPDNIYMSAGVYFTAVQNLDVPPERFIVSNVSFDYFEGSNNQHSIAFDWNNGRIGTVRAINNVTLNHLNLHDDDGNNGSTQAANCSDSLRIINARQVTLMNSILRNVAACNTPTGTAAIILGNTNGVKIVNNMIIEVPNTNSPDQTGLDLEYKNQNAQILSNFFGNNAGPGMEFLGIHGANDYSLNHTVSGNTFFNNFGGGIRRAGEDISPTGIIRDNVHYGEPFLVTSHNGTFNGFETRNNIIVTSKTLINNASQYYANVQGNYNWNYQYRLNHVMVWENIGSYNPSARAWSEPWFGVEINRFETVVGINSAVAARVFSAPTDGIVSIRGRAMLSNLNGDGTNIRITLNDNVIWPTTNSFHSITGGDQIGIETFLDNISVKANDLIRFEVFNDVDDNLRDVVSWIPTITYTKTSTENVVIPIQTTWTGNKQAVYSLENGVHRIVSNGSDPFITSLSNLKIDANKYKIIEIEIKNSTSSRLAQLFFLKEGEKVFSESNSKRLDILSNDIDYKTYSFYMENVPTWNGIVNQLRIDPVNSTGEVLIKSIRLK